MDVMLNRVSIVFWFVLAFYFIIFAVAQSIDPVEDLRRNNYILPKNVWEEHSLDRGNFESDYNIFGGTIYVKRLKPSNTKF